MTTTQPLVVSVRPVRGLLRERAAVLLLTLGSVLLGPLGWVVGLVLLWSSDRWRPWQKALGTLVWPLGYLPVFFLLTSWGQACVSSGGGPEVCEGSVLPSYLAIPLVVAVVGAPLVVGTVLMVVARGRRQHEVRHLARTLARAGVDEGHDARTAPGTPDAAGGRSAAWPPEGPDLRR